MVFLLYAEAPRQEQNRRRNGSESTMRLDRLQCREQCISAPTQTYDAGPTSFFFLGGDYLRGQGVEQIE